MSERPYLRLVEKPPPIQVPRLIEITIAGRNFGRAGPFRLSERGFHELCREARRLERRP
jgi:hypothetical protein